MPLADLTLGKPLRKQPRRSPPRYLNTPSKIKKKPGPLRKPSSLRTPVSSGESVAEVIVIRPFPTERAGSAPLLQRREGQNNAETEKTFVSTHQWLHQSLQSWKQPSRNKDIRRKIFIRSEAQQGWNKRWKSIHNFSQGHMNRVTFGVQSLHSHTANYSSQIPSRYVNQSPAAAGLIRSSQVLKFIS